MRALRGGVLVRDIERMLLELTLRAPPAPYTARDLGFLLHKNPDRLHSRDIAAGRAHLFFTRADDAVATAVLALEVDPVGLVRGTAPGAQGLLSHYVNDRPYAANSFLSVAIAKTLGQTLAGRSKERQDLADRPLDLAARLTPVALPPPAEDGAPSLAETLFAPLGYRVETTAYPTVFDAEERRYADLRLAGQVRLRDLLSHVYVLLPVLDDAKHWWIDEAEVENLLAKGAGWLESHPAKDLIARRALKHQRSLTELALARLAEADAAAAGDPPPPDAEGAPAKAEAESALEEPLRLHDRRLDAVTAVLRDRGAATVLDLGCGEGKLLARLLKEPGVRRIVGVDAAVAGLERAARRLHLDRAGAALSDRLQLIQGGLTYADRRWRGFDAAVLAEVIEHIDPWRLSAVEAAVFGEARPKLVVVTTPNREYNALFAMPADALRHPDHRFEWTRRQFADWTGRVAAAFGYDVAVGPLGPAHDQHGAPSQMAIFDRKAP